MRDGHALCERAVDGAPRGDLRQTLTLLVGEVAAEQQLQLDAVDLALARIARQARLDPIQRPALAFGIQPNREDRSGAERRKHRLRRRRARVLAALVHGLVHQHTVWPNARFRLQVTEPGDFHRSCHLFPLC